MAAIISGIFAGLAVLLALPVAANAARRKRPSEELMILSVALGVISFAVAGHGPLASARWGYLGLFGALAASAVSHASVMWPDFIVVDIIVIALCAGGITLVIYL